VDESEEALLGLMMVPIIYGGALGCHLDILRQSAPLGFKVKSLSWVATVMNVS
jgi:hypothetical protein